MISVEYSTDKKEIKSILADYYDIVTYDGCPSFEDFDPDIENSLWFILKQDNEIAGLIRLESLNLVTFIPHIVIKSMYRGTGSEQWGILVAKYMKLHIPDVNFLVMTPYESAKNYAERMGFKYLGIMPKSIKKNGKLMDQHILSGYPDNGSIK